jgi:hypothetical protein
MTIDLTDVFFTVHWLSVSIQSIFLPSIPHKPFCRIYFPRTLLLLCSILMPVFFNYFQISFSLSSFSESFTVFPLLSSHQLLPNPRTNWVGLLLRLQPQHYPIKIPWQLAKHTLVITYKHLGSNYEVWIHDFRKAWITGARLFGEVACLISFLQRCLFANTFASALSAHLSHDLL